MWAVLAHLALAASPHTPCAWPHSWSKRFAFAHFFLFTKQCAQAFREQQWQGLARLWLKSMIEDEARQRPSYADGYISEQSTRWSSITSDSYLTKFLVYEFFHMFAAASLSFHFPHLQLFNLSNHQIFSFSLLYHSKLPSAKSYCFALLSWPRYPRKIVTIGDREKQSLHAAHHIMRDLATTALCVISISSNHLSQYSQLLRCCLIPACECDVYTIERSSSRQCLQVFALLDESQKKFSQKSFSSVKPCCCWVREVR